MAKENKDKSSLKNYAGGVGSSPLNAFGRADVTLVKGARLASYYSGGSSSTTAGEADTDLIFDPAKKVLEKEMRKKEVAAAMEKCMELGGTWDSINKKCSKDDKDDDSKSDTLTVEGKVDVGGDINVKDSGEATDDPTGPTVPTEGDPPVSEDKGTPGEECECPDGSMSSYETNGDCNCLDAIYNEGDRRCEGQKCDDGTEKVYNEVSGECECAGEDAETDKSDEVKETDEVEEVKEVKNPTNEEKINQEEQQKHEKDLKENNIKPSWSVDPNAVGEDGVKNITKVEKYYNTPITNEYQNVSDTTLSPALTANLGGGKIEKSKSNAKFNKKDGKLEYIERSGTINGKKFNIDFRMVDDGFEFNWTEDKENKRLYTGDWKNVWQRNGKYSNSQWENFVDTYRDLIAKADKSIYDANQIEDTRKRKTAFASMPADQKLALQLRARGFENGLNIKTSELSVREESPADYKEQTPLTFKSPFARRDMTARRIRDKWRPTQPLAYASPLHQEEFATQTPEEQAGMMGGEMPPVKTLWDKIDEYGGMPAINSTVENFINNVDYNPEFDKPLKALQSGDYSGTIQDFANDLANQLKEAGKNKDMKAKQNIMTIADQLIRDVNVFAEKFMSWIDMKGGDKTPGNIGGDMTSKGSDKTFDFNQSTIMMGDPDINMGITTEGKIHFKRNDIPGLISVGDLGKNIMHKNYEGIKTFTEAQQTYHGDSIEGLPLNESVTDGIISGILQTKDALLSWAHDENSGKSWITEYAEANPNEDLSWAMPESEQFDYDRLYDEVHGWMSHKLNEAHTDVQSMKAKKPEPDAAKQILNALQAPTQPQQPQQQPQGSAMAYKTKAQQLIEKYS